MKAKKTYGRIFYIGTRVAFEAFEAGQVYHFKHLEGAAEFAQQYAKDKINLLVVSQTKEESKDSVKTPITEAPATIETTVTKGPRNDKKAKSAD